ncbi:hypothetical protein GCM10027445_24350 [Amycolatopsis endophytica]
MTPPTAREQTLNGSGVSKSPTSWPVGEPPDAVSRLRRYLREQLNAELPQRVADQQDRTGSTATREARRELARGIIDDALRRHTENELAAGRELLSRDVEQRVGDRGRQRAVRYGGVAAVAGRPDGGDDQRQPL